MFVWSLLTSSALPPSLQKHDALPSRDANLFCRARRQRTHAHTQLARSKRGSYNDANLSLLASFPTHNTQTKMAREADDNNNAS